MDSSCQIAVGAGSTLPGSPSPRRLEYEVIHHGLTQSLLGFLEPYLVT